MQPTIKLISLFFIFFLATTHTSLAAITVRAGKMSDTSLIPTLSLEDHYRTAVIEMEVKNYVEAAKHFNIISVNFSHSPEGQNANFYLGACYYEMNEFDWANEAFSRYIKGQSNPEYFEEAIEYKYSIAEKLRNGARRHFYGTKHLPKWATGKTLALEIYHEVIISMPISDIAASAMYAKALLEWEMRSYKEAVDDFQMLIKRFPKHEYAPEAYIAINKVYLDQAIAEFQNPDLIAFAEINLRRFQRDFPKEPRVDEAKKDYLEIKEIYAKGLYDTGRFYERINAPHASVLYYHKALSDFPETVVSLDCRSRLSELAPRLLTSADGEEDTEGEEFELTNLGDNRKNSSISEVQRK